MNNGSAGHSSDSNLDHRPLRQIGQFELMGKIGSGSMGTVYKAYQVALDRVVAIKILPPLFSQDPAYLQRFKIEARSVARLNHPNVVSGIDFGKDPATGLWYFAMEYVDGISCEELLRLRKRLPEPEALAIVHAVANALIFANRRSLVHRDIKPGNILIDHKTGEIKLADLGLVKPNGIHSDSGLQAIQQQENGQAIGTPLYMAPEQARGRIDEIDIRTDLYALGATWFHLVTGRPPYVGKESMAVMLAQVEEPVPYAHQICAEVSFPTSKVIHKMMQKDKADRLQRPEDVVRLTGKLIARYEHNAVSESSASSSSYTGKRANITTAQRQPVSSKLGAVAEALRESELHRVSRRMRGLRRRRRS